MWKKELEKSFGIEDKKFALHPADEKTAQNAIKLAKENGISKEEFLKEITVFLEKNCKSENYILEQTNAARLKLNQLWK